MHLILATHNLSSTKKLTTLLSWDFLYSIFFIKRKTSRWIPICSCLIIYSHLYVVISRFFLLFSLSSSSSPSFSCALCSALVIVIVKLSCECSGWLHNKKKCWSQNEKCRRHNKQLMAIKANIWAGDADAKNVLVNSINYVDDYQKNYFMHFIL